MKKTVILIFALLQILVSTIVYAHPGSGIVIDKNGTVYFTDTGKGVWRIGANGKISYLPAPEFHWMAIDEPAYFANSPKSFGNYFERVTPPNSKPALIMCSDFPLVIGKDGNIYYANTGPDIAKIICRTPDGKESVVASNEIFKFINGIAAGPDGSLYITEASNAKMNTIRKVTMNGTVSTIATYAGQGPNNELSETEPSYCRGLYVDSTGTIYVAATGSRSILRITPQGKLITILQTTNPWRPTGVAIFHGEVYMLEWHDVKPEKSEVRSAWIPRVRKIGLDGKVTTLATVSR